MTRTMKRFLSGLCSVVMCILLVQTPVLQTKAATPMENRIQVGTVAATSDMSEVFGFGKPTTNLNFTCTEGDVVKFYSYGWYRYDAAADKWNSAGSTFVPGKYRYEIQVRVDDYYRDTHVMKKPMDSFKVDGVEWIYNSTYIDSSDTYSWANFDSPEYIIENQAVPLEFTYLSNDLKRRNYMNQPIERFGVDSGVYGGQEPYTYSKTSGPEWISISKEGVVSGTPTATGKNADLVIRVTDAKGDYKEVTLPVGDTILNPEDRQPVNLVKITSNIDTIPMYGNTVENPKMYVLENSPAKVSYNYGWKHKKEDGTWEYYRGEEFVAGTYQFDVQIRMDTPEAYEYQFVKPVQFLVDGVTWDCDYAAMYEEYGWCNVQSPEYVVVEPADAELVFVDQQSYDITKANINHAIEGFSVAESVSGGRKPYTFTKTSGPDWITVSADGTIAGTPDASDGGTLIVRVTDAKGNFKEIAISVSKAVTLPEDREVVSSFAMNSNIDELIEGYDTSKPTFDDDHAFKHEIIWLGWEKEASGAWEAYSGDTFEPGKYRCHVRVNIIGESCAAYMINKNATGVTFKVNDKSWKVDSTSVTDSISSLEAYSNEIIIKPELLEPGWKKIDGKWMYYEDGKPLTGWFKEDGKWYYFDALGIMAKGWVKDNNKWYYFDASGVMVKGWKQISGKWYYFDGGVMVSGWKQISSKWYYFDGGAMVSGWKQISGKWYYFDDGAMASGWKQISGKWYYFDDGAMVSGWKQISGKWYYFDDGAMVSGWKQISGKWYYFDGGVMVSGWKQISGKWYYFKDGAMVTGTQKIDGKTYTFDANGVWVK